MRRVNPGGFAKKPPGYNDAMYEEYGTIAFGKIWEKIPCVVKEGRRVAGGRGVIPGRRVLLTGLDLPRELAYTAHVLFAL